MDIEISKSELLQLLEQHDYKSANNSVIMCELLGKAMPDIEIGILL